MKLAALRVLLSMTALFGLASVASAQTYAGAHELNNCAIPTRILFSNSGIAWPGYWGIKRYVQYPGGALYERQPQPGYSTGKNWPMEPNYAPSQVQNCSNGGPGGTQWLTFRLKTTNYFSAVGNGNGAHLVFSLRSWVPSSSSYDGIGMILMPEYGGMMGERFRWGIDSLVSQRQNPAPSSQIPLQDGVEYAVNIHATANYTSFSITNVTTGAATAFVGMPNPSGYPPVNGTGLIFAVLCSGGVNANCENWNSTQWSVDMWSISSGWF
jgi:hypothetical protein